MSKPTNIQYLDTLRTLATIGVIIIHNATPVLKMMYPNNMEYWWVGNIFDSLFRFVIAMFLMLSGATMLNRDYSLGEFYKKRFMRVLIPFLFWLLAYCIYRWLELKPGIQPQTYDSIIKWVINLFKTEGISKHFWYIYMILVLYLAVPFVGKWVRQIKLNTVGLILIGWVGLNILVNNKFINIPDSMPVIQKAFSYFLFMGYLVLGFYLYNLKINFKHQRYIAIAIYLGTVIFVALATYFLSKSTNKLDFSPYGNMTINTMLQATALFVAFKNKKFSNPIITWPIETISNYSYGIYLVHIMVISLLFNNGIFWTIAHPMLSLPPIIIATLLFSYFIILILRKIPGGKYIAG